MKTVSGPSTTPFNSNYLIYCIILYLNSIFIHHSNEVDILKMLIAKGAQLDVQNNSGKTALQISVSNQHTECYHLLIDAGCDVNIQVLYLIHLHLESLIDSINN